MSLSPPFAFDVVFENNVVWGRTQSRSRHATFTGPFESCHFSGTLFSGLSTVQAHFSYLEALWSVTGHYRKLELTIVLAACDRPRTTQYPHLAEKLLSP